MNNEEFWFRFRGARGGYPTPGPATLKYGGNTTCLEIHAGPHLIIIDAGSGIIGLGQEMLAALRTRGQLIRATLLLTHVHNDHIQGLPLFGPALAAGSQLHIFGPKPLTDENLRDTLKRIMRPPFSPIGQHDLLSRRTFAHLRQGDRIILEDPAAPPQYLTVHDDCPPRTPHTLLIQTHHSYSHPQNGVLVFRITYRERSLVFATDVEGYVGGDQRLIKFSQGADVLIHDAEYDEDEYAGKPLVKQGWGHSTWRMATEVAQASQVKRLFLTHHSPQHDDAYLEQLVAKAQKVFAPTYLAQEGVKVSLTAL
ncbi:MAG TPA: MBL fold metallo-hydrolase [Thermoflexia bacterium]|nr:MBL fold metallo-hydrolase [Thermoflexia bacterium]